MALIWHDSQFDLFWRLGIPFAAIFAIRAMKNASQIKAALLLAVAVLCGATIHAQNLNMVGLNLLRAAVTTNVDGTGIRVAQPEATETPGASNLGGESHTIAMWRRIFSPTFLARARRLISQCRRRRIHARGHDVAGNFYGPSVGLSTNVAHVDNYFADYFIQVFETIYMSSTNYTAVLPSSNINDSVVNQSFDFRHHSRQRSSRPIDSAYDNYAAKL